MQAAAFQPREMHMSFRRLESGAYSISNCSPRAFFSIFCRSSPRPPFPAPPSSASGRNRNRSGRIMVSFISLFAFRILRYTPIEFKCLSYHLPFRDGVSFSFLFSFSFVDLLLFLPPISQLVFFIAETPQVSARWLKKATRRSNGQAPGQRGGCVCLLLVETICILCHLICKVPPSLCCGRAVMGDSIFTQGQVLRYLSATGLERRF